MATPHNSAQLEQIAKTVLMPGDPLRSQFIAENYLTDAVLVNNVRGVQGYTGLWNGKPVTVMASGMGEASIGIYSWELYSHYNVDSIIRIGSAGGISEKIDVRDIVFGEGACTNGGYTNAFKLDGTFSHIADFDLLVTAVNAAKARGIDVHVGNILSSDTFYYPEGKNPIADWRQMGVLAVEMEAAALYANAAYFGKRALAICTITDNLCTGEQLEHDERRAGLKKMIEIALDTAALMD